MLTSRYSHIVSLNNVTTTATNGVGFGDVDLCTAGQFNQGGIVDRVPRYPSLQYEVIVNDSTGSAAGPSNINVQALLPNGSWVTVDALTVAFGATTAKNYFGPFIDLRLSTGAALSTGATIYGYIGKWG